jgi:hypothetical protein
MLSELATFGSRHRDTSLVAKIANQFDDIDGPNPSTKFVPQMEHPNQSVMGHAKASVPDVSLAVLTDLEFQAKTPSR